MSATSLQHMTQSDFMSWRMEADPVLRSTIVAVGLLDRAPDWDRFVAMMRRAVDLVEVFRCKAASDPLGILAPRWVPDPDFDLSWHLRRFTVVEPGYRPLLDFAGSAAMSAFDKDRPLWEFTVLDGLPDGRAALIMKVHHSLTDGLGGMQIARHVVDFTREGAERTDASVTTPTLEDRIRSSVDVGSLGWYAGTIGGLLHRTSTAVARAGSRVVRQPVGAIGDYVATAGSTVRFARPIRTTLSPLMVRRSTRRRVALVDVSIDALRSASAAAGVSMNDAFLAAVLLGVSQYHHRHGKDADRLRITLPISLRTANDPLGGNRITLARLALPTTSSDPGELMREIRAAVRAWRDEPAVALASEIAATLNMLPASTLGDMFKHVDFVASNVTGSPVPMYVAGAKILRYYAFSPTLGSAFNVTLMSYMARCCVGINADLAAVPDLEVFTAAIAEGFEMVLATTPNEPPLDRTVCTSLDEVGKIESTAVR